MYSLGGRDFAAGKAEFLVALDSAERLVREGPDVVANQELLAEILRRQMLLLRLARDYPACRASGERARSIVETLARNYPGVKSHQRRLADTLFSLGVIYEFEKSFAQAEAALRHSAAVYERLAAEHPRDFDIRSSIADINRQMADMLLVRGDYPSAMERLGFAIGAFRSLASLDPGDLYVARLGLWQTLATRGETLMRLGRQNEAAADFGEIVELTRDIKTSELFRIYCALAKARLGDLSALGLLEKTVQEVLNAGALHQMASPYNWYMIYYDGACLRAALAKLALQDQGRSSAERQERAGADIEAALKLLDKAREAGEFKGAVKTDEIRRESLLDPVRSHPRFQLLMMDLAFPDHPFGLKAGLDENASTVR
jgi:eukaryotic-like serine/threonine-protein kinase